MLPDDGGPELRGVSIGGGTGQPNAIRALHAAGCHVSAIVAMADDGGSTGILRQEMGIVPPGDVRKCLVAMADEERAPLARAFEHRFDFADNHALGNLLLGALTEETGSFARAVAVCNRMLGCHGEVYPSTLESVVLCGTTRDGLEFRGQATLGTGPCALSRVWLTPRAPAAYRPAVDAILEADVVVLGPGSLFTSILPNLLVPDVLDALMRTKATLVYVCSMADMQGESWGLTAEEYVDALLSHGLEGRLDMVLLHRPQEAGQGIATRSFQALTQEQVRDEAARRAAGLSPNLDADPDPDWYFRPVCLNDEMIRRIEARVPAVVVRDFSDPVQPTWHNHAKLTNVLKGVLATCRSPQR
jgi:uncharacterized cofD-like protein